MSPLPTIDAMSQAIPLAYLNGRFLLQTEVLLPLNDIGFVMGVTATDLCRTFRHRLFRLPDHLRRFRQSCRLAQIAQIISDKELTTVAEELVRHNASLLQPRQDLALVLIATPGPVGYYLGQDGGAGDGSPTLALHTFPLPFKRYARFFREGAVLAVPSVRQVPSFSVDPRIKQRSRMHWWLAQREVDRTAAGSIALLLDDQGYITETAAANVLIVRKGEVLSPPRTHILEGVTLQVTQELCGRLSIPFREQPLGLADALAADELLLCSTPYGLAGVQKLNETLCAWPGPVYSRLRSAWDTEVGIDIEQQILSNQ